jgi:hypothetical protein
MVAPLSERYCLRLEGHEHPFWLIWEAILAELVYAENDENLVTQL